MSEEQTKANKFKSVAPREIHTHAEEQTKNRGGRPKANLSEKEKKVQLTFQVSVEQKEKLDEIAKREDLSVSKIIRNAVLERIKQG